MSGGGRGVFFCPFFFCVQVGVSLLPASVCVCRDPKKFSRSGESYRQDKGLPVVAKYIPSRRVDFWHLMSTFILCYSGAYFVATVVAWGLLPDGHLIQGNCFRMKPWLGNCTMGLNYMRKASAKVMSMRTMLYSLKWVFS